MLVMMMLPATPVSAAVHETLEGYTLEPAEKWTTGAVKGWAEGDCIPYRYTVENNGNDPVPLNLTLQFDHKTDGTIGIVGFENFVIPGGNITGPTLDGSGVYYWDVTIPAETTYVLEWCARLSNEAGLWPGAKMHVGADGKEVPITVTSIRMPDLYATKSANVTCDAISYTINYGNNGDADQSNTVLVDDYDEIKVAVTDDGGGIDNGDTITWNIGSLAAGATGSKSYTVSINGGIANGAAIVNTGNITGDLAEDNYTDNAYSVTSYAKVSPTVGITPDPAEACLGVNLQLHGNPSGGSGTYTHSWTGNGATYLSSTTIENPVFNSNTVGTYNLTYTVTDANGCIGSDNIAVTVIDCTDPVIVKVTQSEDEPCADVAVNITAYVTDDVGVTSVNLTYDSMTVPMVLTGGTPQAGNWTATIPGQPACTTLSIYVTATDGVNTVSSTPHDKHWKDCTDPVIVKVTQSEDEPCADVAVNITAYVTDDVGVTSVNLTYDSMTVPMTPVSGTPQAGNWTATIPGQPACTTLSIYVTATDGVNTVSSTPHEKHWKDCRPTLTINKTDNPDPVNAGGTLTYTITVTNTGNVNATGVTVVDNYDEDVLTIIDADGGINNDDTITWNGKLTIPAGGSLSYNIVATVSPAASPGLIFYNTANVTCAEGVSESITISTRIPVPRRGGGGGGCPTIKYLTVDWDGEITDEPLNRSDQLAEELLGPSPDYKHSLLLEQGTHAPIVDEETYYLIVVRELDETQRPPLLENTVAIVAFNVTPDDAVFDRDIFLTLGLDQVQLPENAINGTLTLAYYDDVSGTWEDLEYKAGGLPNSVAELSLSTAITHFTIYAVLVEVAPPSPPPPAHFVPSGLNIVPSVERIWEPITFATKIGESVTITFNVDNDGGQEGNYPVELKLNGKTIYTKTAPVGAAQRQRVEFTLSELDYGQYEVEVNELSKTFTTSLTITWWLIILIIAAIGLIIWGVVWGRRRRRRRAAQEG